MNPRAGAAVFGLCLAFYLMFLWVNAKREAAQEAAWEAEQNPLPTVAEPAVADPASSYNFNMSEELTGDFDPMMQGSSAEIARRLKAALAERVRPADLYVRPTTKDEWLGELGTITVRYEVEASRYRYKTQHAAVPYRLKVTLDVQSRGARSSWDGRREVEVEVEPPMSVTDKNARATHVRYSELLVDAAMKEIGVFRRE